MTNNKDLKVALKSQLELHEKHFDENLTTMARLQDQLEWYKEMNKDLLDRMKKLTAQIGELK